MAEEKKLEPEVQPKKPEQAAPEVPEGRGLIDTLLRVGMLYGLSQIPYSEASRLLLETVSEQYEAGEVAEANELRKTLKRLESSYAVAQRTVADLRARIIEKNSKLNFLQDEINRYRTGLLK